MLNFQNRVWMWASRCFGEKIATDKVERGDRTVEEVFELLQAGGYDPARIAPLRDYVWSRPVGEPSQELGGVMVTLAAYACAHGLEMKRAGEAELERISAPEVILKIRAKQAAKPTGSALPISQTEPDIDLQTRAAEAVGKAALELAVYYVKGERAGWSSTMNPAAQYLEMDIAKAVLAMPEVVEAFAALEREKARDIRYGAEASPPPRAGVEYVWTPRELTEAMISAIDPSSDYPWWFDEAFQKAWPRVLAAADITKDAPR